MAGRRLVVDGRRAVVLRLGRLGLITSAVDAREFSPEGLAQRRADRKWLRAQARHHEHVLERLRAAGDVCPAPFLTVFESVDAFDAASQEHYRRWSRALSRVSGKNEYGVHAFAGPHALPDAEPYVLRVAQRATQGRVSARIRAGATPLEAHLRDLWEALRSSATTTRRFDLRGLRGFLLGATLLADERGETLLRASLSALAPAGHELGVSVYLEGPRPPFSFG